MEIRQGAAELRRLLDDRVRDVRAMEAAEFRGWLLARLERWRGDPVFAQRSRIRDLRRAHPPLAPLEAAARRAAADDAASAVGARLRDLEREILDTGKAVQGLTARLGTAEPAAREAVREKLASFRARRREAGEEHRRLAAASPERRARVAAEEELRRLREEIGLDEAERRLTELLRERGRGSGRAGAAFEGTAGALTGERLLPFLDAGARGVRILRGVTLGAARTEIDQLVVRAPEGEEGPVEVLALVEAKRNVNDLAHGFLRRQENLGWLTGDAASYDPAAYRTRHFAGGHFDRVAVHEEGGARFAFDRGSFRRFRRDPATGFFLDGVCLVTRAGPIWGISTGALGRVEHRVATDPAWAPDDPGYLERLLAWCRAQAGPVETPEVLRIFASDGALGRQVLVVEGAG